MRDDPTADEPFDLDRSARTMCPWCGETVELLVDPGGGAVQEYVEDCEVCCRPWSVRLTFGRDGRVAVRLEGLDR